jgi:hypothetical protein
MSFLLIAAMGVALFVWALSRPGRKTDRSISASALARRN